MSQTKSAYLESIALLDSQLKQAYDEARKIKFAKEYSKINKIVTCGMGGSQLGVDLIKHLFSQELSLPIIQVKNYDLPKFIDRQTLVFLLSYSGTTEEVLNNLRIIRKNKARAIIITSGGALAKISKSKKIPAYIFKPIFNPSAQPRLGTGYLIGSMVAILRRLRILKVSDNQVAELIKAAKLSFLEYKNLNQIQSLSQKLVNKIPVIVASEFLLGNAHIMANQINESAKQTAIYFAIPELNHHLLEGLTFPKGLKSHWHFLFFTSKDYNPRNQIRHQLTQKILSLQNIAFNQIKFRGDKINQAMEMLVFGSLLSYQMSKLNKVDPNKIPWVDYLKAQLKK